MMYDLSSCTRILTTPIPLSWTRHTTRFMVLWLFLLPLALYRTCGWGTPWAIAFVSLALLTIGERFARASVVVGRFRGAALMHVRPATSCLASCRANHPR